MKQIALSLLLLWIASTAHAACYADYKAKRDTPLRLHYGVIELYGSCDRASAYSEIASRLAGSGWAVLNVMSVFDESGLRARQANAGQYYLRF